MPNNTIKKAAFCAELSCPKWNKNRLSRLFYARRYQDMAKEYWESKESQETISKYKKQHENCVNVNETFLWHLLDTYPWPYNDIEFANWKEDYSEADNTIVFDQSNCVIRHETSYAAWKIFEATGIWPNRKAKEIVTPKEWQDFLAEAGYRTIIEVPHDNGYYVGINPDLEDPIVWYEGTMKGNLVTSTYKQKSYRLLDSKPEDYTWIKIK